MVSRRHLKWLILQRLIHVEGAFAPEFSSYSRYSSATFSTRLFVAPEKEDVAQEYYEVTRYRNRAALLQETLKQKLDELQVVSKEFRLADSKTKVLQDVVKRLSGREKQGQKDAARRIEELEKELEKIGAELTTQSKQDQGLIDTLKQQLKETRNDLDKNKSLHTKQLEGEQEKRGALKNEMLHLDEKLEQTQDELRNLQKTLDSKQDEARKAMSREQRARERLEKELANAIAEKNRTLSKLQEMTESDQERLESIEIAKGAVESAEQREAQVRKELDQLQSKFGSVLGENAQLQKKLQDLKYEHETLSHRVKEYEKEQKDDPSLAERLQESEKENKELKLEVERNIARLEQERVNLASKRKTEKEKYEKLLEEERSNHAEQIQRLKDDLFQKTLDNNKGLQEARLDDESSTQGRGLWKRISKARSRFFARNKDGSSD